MYKVLVNVPASITSLGPGLNTVGLALGLHVTMQVSVRQDGDLDIEANGEGAANIPKDYRNPVVRAASRVFQAREMAPSGLNIIIENRIPFDVGIEVESALFIGGLVAANNLTGAALSRDTLIEIATEMKVGHLDALTMLLGGLNVGVMGSDGALLHSSHEPPPLRLVVFVPNLTDYHPELPETIRLEDAVFNLGRIVFLIEALVKGDLNLLGKAIQDRLYQDAYTSHIPGYAAASAAALSNGAAAVTLAGHGPAMLIFAPYNHALIVDSMREAFRQAGISECRHWIVGIDAQGVTVSVAS